jgi:hypothetical protein
VGEFVSNEPLWFREKKKTSPGWAAGNNNNGSQAGGAENSLLFAAPDQRQGVTSLKGALEGGRVAGLWLAVEYGSP